MAGDVGEVDAAVRSKNLIASFMSATDGVKPQLYSSSPADLHDIFCSSRQVVSLGSTRQSEEADECRLSVRHKSNF
jgi:hypothetical protein